MLSAYSAVSFGYGQMRLSPPHGRPAPGRDIACVPQRRAASPRQAVRDHRNDRALPMSTGAPGGRDRLAAQVGVPGEEGPRWPGRSSSAPATSTAAPDHRGLLVRSAVPRRFGSLLRWLRPRPFGDARASRPRSPNTAVPGRAGAGRGGIMSRLRATHRGGSHLQARNVLLIVDEVQTGPDAPASSHINHGVGGPDGILPARPGGGLRPCPPSRANCNGRVQARRSRQCPGGNGWAGRRHRRARCPRGREAGARRHDGRHLLKV